MLPLPLTVVVLCDDAAAAAGFCTSSGEAVAPAIDVGLAELLSVPTLITTSALFCESETTHTHTQHRRREVNECGQTAPFVRFGIVTCALLYLFWCTRGRCTHATLARRLLQYIVHGGGGDGKEVDGCGARRSAERSSVEESLHTWSAAATRGSSDIHTHKTEG